MKITKYEKIRGGEYLEKFLNLCFMLIMFIAKSNVTENLSTFFMFEPNKNKDVKEFFLIHNDSPRYTSAYEIPGIQRRYQ